MKLGITGKDVTFFVWFIVALRTSAVNMLCIEHKEAFEILMALDFYLCNICAQSLQARRIWFAAYLMYVFFIAISTGCSNGMMRYSDPEAIFIHSRLSYFLENTKNRDAPAVTASLRIVE
jgi:hypothetical protein